MGQAVDCYLAPATARRVRAPAGYATAGTRTLAAARAADDSAGLGGLVLLIVGMFVVSSLLTGLQFYLMTYAGQNVLRAAAHRGLRAHPSPVARLLQQARGGRRDEPHHQRRRHDPAGDRLSR